MSWTWLNEGQTLIAGVVGGLLGGLASGFVGGWLASRATFRAAERQASATREDTKAARNETDKRRRLNMEEAVSAEERRLKMAVWALNPSFGGGGGLPSGPQCAIRRKEDLVIASSPLLRGEPEDMALLDNATRGRIEEIAAALHDYNSRIQTATDPSGSAPFITRGTLDSFDRLDKAVQSLDRSR